MAGSAQGGSWLQPRPEGGIGLVAVKGHRATHQRSIEELVAAFAGSFGDQLTAMAGRAMGGPDVERMVGVMLSAEGIVAAEQGALKGLLQVAIEPLAGFHQAAQGALGPGAAGEQQDAVAVAARLGGIQRPGIDALANRAGAIAAVERHLGDQQVAEAVQQQVGGAWEGEIGGGEAPGLQPVVLKGLDELAAALLHGGTGAPGLDRGWLELEKQALALVLTGRHPAQVGGQSGAAVGLGGLNGQPSQAAGAWCEAGEADQRLHLPQPVDQQHPSDGLAVPVSCCAGLPNVGMEEAVLRRI
jgi:hypothetical protein